jgi:hypothetical protein
VRLTSSFLNGTAIGGLTPEEYDLALLSERLVPEYFKTDQNQNLTHILAIFFF